MLPCWLRSRQGVNLCVKYSVGLCICVCVFVSVIVFFYENGTLYSKRFPSNIGNLTEELCDYPKLGVKLFFLRQ